VLGPGRAPEVVAAAVGAPALVGEPKESGEEETAVRSLWSGRGRRALRPPGERHRAEEAQGLAAPEREREGTKAGPALRLARGRARSSGQGAAGERPEPGGIRDRRAEDCPARLPGVSARWPS